MSGTRLSLSLAAEAQTRALADRLAAALGAGDTLLLDGPIGAGKTAFARALIQAAQTRAGLPPEDVPSPTFTLVQTYEAGPFEIWHADLYRLGHPHEVLELGLDEAFDLALCLIEWPDRLGDLAPADALRLTFGPGPSETARTLDLVSADPSWADRLSFLAAKDDPDA
ncbi:tRNA (adenosine(37)-N6)-threonylcarbamoyltransferase complex ATPase subunit type 1 TsaE [Rhodovulum viride]|uniref:tRNA threonylcarbamoyladenosine biosynthesis protein TsaE n=1 Tax=Rhodovulum viride TaxID=1231134 RepID=A0ABX9DL04_9RHOB|nr:tRNA (adenosine(37)-N6)-threonylcarbamoyltransferase complex ATPase subunit type 1 TsaE [Rhodovulum viride]RAP42260.1 tRNA (adenosine(37)-N6)-threonylcarbamoyltransferase complex ATPase subunit type 1 TsaE [Rhodovulum viride]